MFSGKSIGGNTAAVIQISSITKNAIGEGVASWTNALNIYGYLDLINGDSKRTEFNTKLQDSTHVFICDYMPVESRITPEKARLVCGGYNYDILLIDDPMGLHKQLEILLRFRGK